MNHSHFGEAAYAKINLALHVRRRRTDGYHELETVFAFAEDGDMLTIAPADDFSLNITGRFAEGLSTGADNLVLRAARLLQQRCGIAQGARFTLDKRLPVAAGIGGGSADAAAALRLAARLWGLDAGQVLTANLGTELGADVPACLSSQTCRGTGVGEQLTPFCDATISGRPSCSSTLCFLARRGRFSANGTGLIVDHSIPPIGGMAATICKPLQ